MILYFKIFKTLSYKLKASKLNKGRAFRQAGMTYVELIVVLSIFATMSSIVLFDYGTFQAKIDIRNLANDIALRVVEAQKSAMGGKFTTKIPQVPSWKPAYGIYFNFKSGDGGNRASFSSFADLNNDTFFSDFISSTICLDSADVNDECTEKVLLTRGNTISKIEIFYTNSSTSTVSDSDYLSVVFTRPNSVPVIALNGVVLLSVSYIQITISPPQSVTLAAKIRVYASGRIQVN